MIVAGQASERSRASSAVGPFAGRLVNQPPRESSKPVDYLASRRRSSGHTPRMSIVLTSAVAFALLMLLASDSAAAAAGKPPAALPASSQSIEAEIDAAERRRVLHSFSALRFRPVTSAISPEQLDATLGASPTASPANPANPLPEVDVQARAPPRAPPAPLQSRIPFGLAAVVWAFRHPSEAWRIFLPIPSEAGPSLSGPHAATPPGRQSAGKWKTAVKVA